MAQVDYFLKIAGIDGESTDDKHKGEIDIDSFAWGETQSGTGGRGGGGGAGKVSMQDIHFTAKVSKASNKLLLACASGEHLKEATLTVRKAGKEQQEYYKIKFTDCLVSSYQVGSGGGVVPTDQFSLNFAKGEWEYKAQKADGSLDAPVKVGWDLAANKPV